MEVVTQIYTCAKRHRTIYMHCTNIYFLVLIFYYGYEEVNDGRNGEEYTDPDFLFSFMIVIYSLRVDPLIIKCLSLSLVRISGIKSILSDISMATILISTFNSKNIKFNSKNIKVYCGVSNICRSEVYDNNSINDGMALGGIIL